jgi:hypothetical protein
MKSPGLHSAVALVIVGIAGFGLMPGFDRPIACAEEATTSKVLQNEYVTLTVIIQGERLLSERLSVQPAWASKFGTKQTVSIETDADFGLELMYTDWRAPGKQNNADNPVVLGKTDFTIVRSQVDDLAGGTKEIAIVLKGKEAPIDLRITYRLEAGAFYIRKNIAVLDTAFGHHFLRGFWPVRGSVKGITGIVKDGDFGQPVAVLSGSGGAFFGLEYPASENRLSLDGHGHYVLQCGQEYGERVGKTWLQSEWVVEAITPDEYVKNWFFKYVDAIRVAPLRPYTLYNSWYDLRSPEYPRVPPENVMSERSALKMIDLLRKNMIDLHGIQLDAFVLDDGWDVYKSDWLLRGEQFPNGLKPLADELKKTGTSLGVWFGPTGGYSFRKQRIGWMQEHGYETVDDQLCIAGKNYGPLLKKRVTDFAQNDGVGYYKWDGIQFSCSEPDHGHPIDIYSRRAVMESVIGMCRAVREKNPAMFLNITSGTWLSPWWVKYANTIWMDGADYGYADVPSISKRDAAITYRDFVLYEDFSLKGLWFPIANLMTHGIIKGKLEMLGSPEEPLDKFTDDVLLYFGRGVSMYELYISPDIISEGEWNTLASSITWAKDRFPILSTSSMIGGNPMKREPYGYAHFNGKRGIIAARNPYITSSSLTVELSASLGLEPKAQALVVERVYPTCWIAPRLYNAGERLDIPLDGYEMAVYEIYPVEDATLPLVAGVVFDANMGEGSRYDVKYHSAMEGARLLNPEVVTRVTAGGLPVDPRALTLKGTVPPPVVTNSSVTRSRKDDGSAQMAFTISASSSDARLAILLTPDESQKSKGRPTVNIVIDGKGKALGGEDQEERSQWYTIGVLPGKHMATLTMAAGKDPWSGTASVWLVSHQRQETAGLSCELKAKPVMRPMPPHPWPSGEVRRTIKLGEARISAGTVN